jgi:hypothetical protein
VDPLLGEPRQDIKAKVHSYEEMAKLGLCILKPTWGMNDPLKSPSVFDCSGTIYFDSEAWKRGEGDEKSVTGLEPAFSKCSNY